MSKNVPFQIGTIVTADFLNAIQELQVGSVHNARFAPSNLGNDRVALALTGDIANDGMATVNVGGRYCFTQMTKDSDPASSGDGEKGIFLATTMNDSPQQPDFDIVVGAAPSASYLRKLGSADLVSGQLHNVRFQNGLQADAEQYNSFDFRSVMDNTNENILTLRGHNNQASTAPGPEVGPSNTPTRALRVGFEDGSADFVEHMYIDTAGRIVWEDRSGGTDHVSLTWVDNDAGAGTRGALGVSNEFTSHIEGTNTVSTVDWGYTSFSGRAIDVDTENRFEISNTGVFSWGPGDDDVDTTLYRQAPGELTLDTSTLHTNHTVQAGDPSTILITKEYADNELGASDSVSRRFAFFIGR